MKIEGSSQEDILEISNSDHDSLLKALFQYRQEFTSLQLSLVKNRENLLKPVDKLERRESLDKLANRGLEFPIKKSRSQLDRLLASVESALTKAIGSIDALVERTQNNKKMSNFDIVVLTTQIDHLAEPVLEAVKSTSSGLENFTNAINRTLGWVKYNAIVHEESCPFLVYVKTRGRSDYGRFATGEQVMFAFEFMELLLNTNQPISLDGFREVKGYSADSGYLPFDTHSDVLSKLVLIGLLENLLDEEGGRLNSRKDNRRLTEQGGKLVRETVDWLNSYLVQTAGSSGTKSQPPLQ